MTPGRTTGRLRPIDPSHGKAAATEGSRSPRAAAAAGPSAASTDQLARIRLTGDRLLVRPPDDSERRSKGGLVIPATAAHPIRRCVWSEVVLAGPETRSVKRGDRVLFIPQTGLEADIDGEVFLLLRERDIQAIVPSDQKDHQAGQYL